MDLSVYFICYIITKRAWGGGGAENECAQNCQNCVIYVRYSYTCKIISVQGESIIQYWYIEFRNLVLPKNAFYEEKSLKNSVNLELVPVLITTYRYLQVTGTKKPELDFPISQMSDKISAEVVSVGTGTYSVLPHLGISIN